MNRHMRLCLLLWPWPWPDDLHIRTRPVFRGDTPDVQIWTSQVKVSKIIVWQTDIHRVWVKKVPAKTFCDIFLSWCTCVIENYLSYCPNIFLHLHQFWSIYLNICVKCIIFTALHGMQTRSSDENSVCPSVCPPNACIVTKRKKNLSRFLYHTKDHLA